MKAYRVQKRTDAKIGPFRGCGYNTALHEVLFSNLVDWKHPTPNHDGMKFHFAYNKNLFFGCFSLDQIERWFEHAYTELFDSDFVIAVYEIDETISLCGNTQIAFNLDQADLVEIIEFFELV